MVSSVTETVMLSQPKLNEKPNCFDVVVVAVVVYVVLDVLLLLLLFILFLLFLLIITARPLLSLFFHVIREQLPGRLRGVKPDVPLVVNL